MINLNNQLKHVLHGVNLTALTILCTISIPLRASEPYLLEDRFVLSWGNNDSGQLGDSTVYNQRLVPVKTKYIDRTIAVANGSNHTLALDDNGTVWAYGWNFYGQLGIGTNEEKLVPTELNIDHSIVAIAAGSHHSLALQDDGTVLAWGYNRYGQLGDGTDKNRSVPTKINCGNNVVAITAGDFHSLALLDDGTVLAWGTNFSGQLGDGTNIDRQTPAPVKKLTNIIAIAAGYYYNLALDVNGIVYSWGENYQGQLGIDSNVNQNIPMKVKKLPKICAIAAGEAHSLALKEDHTTVFAWGRNVNGQLGDGTNSERWTPVPVKKLTNITEIAAGRYHSLALRNDHAVFAWGSNKQGQLGDGTTTDRNIPVQTIDTIISKLEPGLIGSIKKVVEHISAGWAHNSYIQTEYFLSGFDFIPIQ